MVKLNNKSGNLEVIVNENNFVVYVKNIHYEGFALKYKVGAQWFYQHLMLGCRGGAKNYFKQAKELYIHIRRNKITNTSFKRLAV